MPGPGAMPDHAYLRGDVFAAYRLRGGVDRFVTAREAGIGFEGEPAAGDATSTGAGGSTTPPAATDSAKPPATGDDAKPDADGMTSDAGREALRKERERAKRAEDALADERAKHATDDEKRDASVKAAGAAEERAKWIGRLRAVEVRSALRAKGLTDEKQLGLAARAQEFADLEPGDDDAEPFPGLAKVVDAFAKDYPALFATADKPKPQPTRGIQAANGASGQKSLGDAIAAKYAGS